MMRFTIGWAPLGLASASSVQKRGNLTQMSAFFPAASRSPPATLHAVCVVFTCVSSLPSASPTGSNLTWLSYSLFATFTVASKACTW